jgi:hypothetical protein
MGLESKSCIRLQLVLENLHDARGFMHGNFCQSAQCFKNISCFKTVFSSLKFNKNK